MMIIWHATSFYEHDSMLTLLRQMQALELNQAGESNIIFLYNNFQFYLTLFNLFFKSR